MTIDEDPPRLPRDSRLGVLVNEARKETLAAKHRAKLWAALESVPAPAPAQPSSQVFRLGTVKIGLACVGVSALLLATSALRDADKQAITPSASVSTVSSQPEEARAASPVASAPAIEPDKPDTSEPSALDRASAAPVPIVDTAPNVGVRTSSPLPSKATSSASALDEGTLLLEAKRAVSTAPQRALDLTDAHARSFPSSKLGAERASIRIDALARLGKCEQVLAEGTQFGISFPSSPHAALVSRARTSCSR